MTELVASNRKSPNRVVRLALLIVIIAVIVIAVLYQGRPIDFFGIHIGSSQPTTESKKQDAASKSIILEQSTKGDNSPAVQGVEGDVNLNIEQKKNTK